MQGFQELKINDDGKLLKMAWDWKLQNIPDFQIRKKLSIRGLKITKQTISAMWRNPFYCGIQKNKFLEGGDACPLNAAIVVRDMRTTSADDCQATVTRLLNHGVEAIGITENFLRS